MTLLQGTVVCRSDRAALAVVEDVFGPVSAPRYLLRFASQKAMEELDVRPGLPVFYPKVLPPRCSCCAPFCFLRDRGLQGQAYLVKREELYQKVAAFAARACMLHFSRVLLPVIALTGVGAGLGRLQCTRRGSGRARAGLRAHRLSPSSSRLLMLCANRSSATTSKKWRPRFGLLQRAVHVDVGV